MPSVAELSALMESKVDTYMAQFEGRLSTAMTKALDTVLYDTNERLTRIEEDQARILRHLGLDK